MGGEWDGELLGEVDLVSVDESVDELVDQCRDRRLEALHPSWREQRVEDFAELSVLWRIDLKGDEWSVVFEDSGSERRGVQLWVVQHNVDEIPRADQHPDTVHAHDRSVVAQHPVCRLG